MANYLVGSLEHSSLGRESLFDRIFRFLEYVKIKYFLESSDLESDLLFLERVVQDINTSKKENVAYSKLRDLLYRYLHHIYVESLSLEEEVGNGEIVVKRNELLMEQFFYSLSAIEKYISLSENSASSLVNERYEEFKKDLVENFIAPISSIKINDLSVKSFKDFLKEYTSGFDYKVLPIRYLMYLDFLNTINSWLEESLKWHLDLFRKQADDNETEEIAKSKLSEGKGKEIIANLEYKVAQLKNIFADWENVNVESIQYGATSGGDEILQSYYTQYLKPGFSFLWKIQISWEKEYSPDKIGYLILTFSKALQSISGTHLELGAWGNGSKWLDFKLWIKNTFSKELVKDVLMGGGKLANKAKEGLEAKYIGLPKSEEDKIKAETKNIILESKKLKDDISNSMSSDQADRFNEAIVRKAEAEANLKLLEVISKAKELMADGLDPFEDVSIYINGSKLIDTSLNRTSERMDEIENKEIPLSDIDQEE